MDFRSEERSSEPRLDNRTHLDHHPEQGQFVSTVLDASRPSGPHLVCKIKQYSPKHAQLTAVKVIEPLRRKSSSSDRPVLDEDEKEKSNKHRSIRRSRQTVKDKALTMQADRMLTLTYRENVTDRTRAFKDFNKFIRLVRKYHGDIQYVAVAEKQKRGAFHFHLAINRFYDVRNLRALWHRVVGKDNGNIDISRKHNPAGRPVDPAKIAAYLSKYMSKEFGDEEHVPGRNRYRVSLGIVVPLVVGFMPLAAGSEVYFLTNVFKQITGTDATGIWESHEFQCICLDNFKPIEG